MDGAPGETLASGHHAPPHHGVLGTLRNKFVAGVVVLVPIVITIQALRWLFAFVDGLAKPLAEYMVGTPIPGIGFLMTVVIVFLAGLLFSEGPLRKLLELVEARLEDVPLIGTVYGTAKKVLAGFGGDGAERAFKRFVLARLPGRTTPGFLTGSFELTSGDGQSRRMCTVYVPTNHLYVGDVVVLPVEDVIETDLSIEDGITLILSAGSSVPDKVGTR